MKFDLLTEPWLPVVTLDGVHTEVSLSEVFSRAHELRWLEGEVPVVTAALHRMLLAFAHRVYGPEDADEWTRLWRARSLHEHSDHQQRFEEYVAGFSDRFDLFHATHPFLQTPRLQEKTMGNVAQLLPHRASGNNATLFDHTTAADQLTVAPAQAARWLVTAQAFDTGGLKTPWRADKTSEPGLANRFATTLLEGATLHETLLLNMPLYHPRAGYPQPTSTEDCPVWEQPHPPGPDPDKDGRAPAGWAEVLTWPSRRVLLRAKHTEDGLRVDGAVLTPGTRLRTELPNAELMAAYRYRTKRPRGSPVKTGNPQPVVLEELRGVWRHARELLLGDWEEAHRGRPRTLEHVAEMSRAERLDPDTVYTLRVFGQQLNSQGGAVHAWQQETVPAPVALLRVDERHPAVGDLLGWAVGLADDVGDALSTLETAYTREIGDSNSSKIAVLTQWYWPRLSELFSELLRAVGSALNEEMTGAQQRALDQAWTRWRSRVAETAEQAATRWAEELPRRCGRQLQALAPALNDFHNRLAELRRTFDVTVARYFDPDEEDDD